MTKIDFSNCLIIVKCVFLFCGNSMRFHTVNVFSNFWKILVQNPIPKKLTHFLIAKFDVMFDVTIVSNHIATY